LRSRTGLPWRSLATTSTVTKRVVTFNTAGGSCWGGRGCGLFFSWEAPVALRKASSDATETNPKPLRLVRQCQTLILERLILGPAAWVSFPRDNTRISKFSGDISICSLHTCS
jgi:hypothetical protein